MDKTRTFEIIQKHKCSICHHYLSVFPVHFKKTQLQDTYRCGRCKTFSMDSWFRQLLFEKLAQFSIFPCSYIQCNKKLPWIKMEAHEKYCVYKVLKCPVCCQDIPLYKLAEHFGESHQDLIVTTDTYFKNSPDQNVRLLTHLENHSFLAFILNNKISVIAMDRNKYTKFNVQVRSNAEDASITVEFRNLPVAVFDERIHCCACLKGSCKLAHHPRSSGVTVNDFMIQLGKEWLQNFFDDNKVLSYRIVLIGDDTVTDLVEEQAEEVEESKENGYVTAAKESLMCPYCMSYMMAPIYMCLTGHVVCNMCKLKLKACPTCKATLTESRNFPLEELASTIEVPCQHHSKGCAFIAISSRMRVHEADCPFESLG